MESISCTRKTSRVILNNLLTLKTLHLFVGFIFLCIFVSNNNNMDFNRLLIQTLETAELEHIVKNSQYYLEAYSRVCSEELTLRQNQLKSRKS